MNKLKILISILFLVQTTQAQDLLSLLDSANQSTPVQEYIQGTFKSPRLINGYTSEIAGKNDLVFSISHRFGKVKGGINELFGLDESTMRLGFEYGLLKKISLGIGRSNFNKMYDGYFKWKIISQSSGKKSFPLTISLMEGMAVRTGNLDNLNLDYPLTSRFYYVHELFISRKVSEKLSLQLVPVVVHRNMVKTKGEQNTVPAMGFGGVFNVNNWLSINSEFFYLFPGNTANSYSNSLSIGVEMDSGGGHVFQVQLSNSQGMTEKPFITETNGKWSKGDIYLGFNLIRVFHTKK